MYVTESHSELRKASYDKQYCAIQDRREMLRIKLKSLMEEARIIRKEERRTFGAFRDELHLHRIMAVRQSARETHLAYGFIRGLKLEQMEATSHVPPSWEAIRKMIKKYGPKGFVEPDCMKGK